MKKVNTAPISGMQELLPAQQALFNQIKAQILQVYTQHGFQNIETPIIDRTEILLAKAGGDTEKQIYKVVKTAETADDADQALRFDHTVPLARYVVEHQNDLTFPFKVSQVGRNFRGERAQKGRFREFYQLDIDVVGRGQLPIAYDAEVAATAVQALQTFVRADLLLRVSNRKLLTGLLEELQLTQYAAAIYSIVDHAEKVTPEKTQAAFQELALAPEIIDQLTTFISLHGSVEEVGARLQEFQIENQTFTEGVTELTTVMHTLTAQHIPAEVDLKIVRGLDYYTSTVYETVLPEYKQIGSICSGGRYDNLAGHYTEQALPGVGISIGLTRLFYILSANNLLDHLAAAPVDVAIAPISEQELPFAYQLAERIRATGRSADVILTDKKLGDKLTYAAKVAKSAIVVGENEVVSGQVNVKNLDSGELTPLDEFLQD